MKQRTARRGDMACPKCHILALSVSPRRTSDSNGAGRWPERGRYNESNHRRPPASVGENTRRREFFRAPDTRRQDGARASGGLEGGRRPVPQDRSDSEPGRASRFSRTRKNPRLFGGHGDKKDLARWICCHKARRLTLALPLIQLGRYSLRVSGIGRHRISLVVLGQSSDQPL